MQGAIEIARAAHEKFLVMGGNRIDFKQGFRFTPYPSVKFAGMVDNEAKGKYLNHSKGLVYPIRWHEPFGLAIIESLFFGCPVFGTTYGSLPELVKGDVGFLSNNSAELAEAIKTKDLYSPKRCHDYANDLFNAREMAYSYLIRITSYNVCYTKLLRALNKSFA